MLGAGDIGDALDAIGEVLRDRDIGLEEAFGGELVVLVSYRLEQDRGALGARLLQRVAGVGRDRAILAGGFGDEPGVDVVAQGGQEGVDAVSGDGIDVDIDDAPGVLREVADELTRDVDLVLGARAVIPLVRRGVDPDIRDRVQLRDAAQAVLDDGGLRLQLVLVADVHEVAADAVVRVRMIWLDAHRRGLDDLLGNGVNGGTLLPENPGADDVARRRAGDEDRLAVGETDALAVADDAVDRDVDSAVLDVGLTGSGGHGGDSG